MESPPWSYCTGVPAVRLPDLDKNERPIAPAVEDDIEPAVTSSSSLVEIDVCSFPVAPDNGSADFGRGLPFFGHLEGKEGLAQRT